MISDSNPSVPYDSGTISAIAGCARRDGNTQAVFTDSTKNWAENEWAGGTLRITSGNGKFRKFDIISNTATLLQFSRMKMLYVQLILQSVMPKHGITPFRCIHIRLAPSRSETAMLLPNGTKQNGFGQTWNKTITAMRIFEGKLYVSTGLNYKYGGQIWFTADGDTWSVTKSIRDTVEPYTNHSFGNFHT